MCDICKMVSTIVLSVFWSQERLQLMILFLDFPSTGRYRILVLASDDILSSSGISARTLTILCSNVLPNFPYSVIKLVFIHPFPEQRFEWTDLPRALKDHAEMRFHGVGVDDVYTIYGVDARRARSLS
jgi:phenol 2-monooxygenase (NADPH)